MMIFPQPQQMDILPGAYQLCADLAKLPLVAFFQQVKAGIPGVTVTTEPLLGKEE